MKDNIKCDWKEKSNGWVVACCGKGKWFGGYNSTMDEMQENYNYCPSCGGKINFIPLPTETELIKTAINLWRSQ